VIVTLIVAIGFLLAGAGLVARDTVRRSGKWGINLRRVACPRCEQPMPRIRAPKTLQQGMWGGSTCACGCEVDKWGREVA
jgi:hypothetical protein